MKKLIIILFLLFICVFAYRQIFNAKESYNNKEEQKEKQLTAEPVLQSETKAGDEIKAPAFTLTSTNGKQINLSDYKGKIVILDFWATWCAPCRKGIPDLIEIQKQYKDNVVIVGISLDQQNTISYVIPFMKEFGINYPVVYGNEKVVVDYGSIPSIPTSFIIDNNGNVVDVFIGLVPKSTYVTKIKNLISQL